MKESFLIKYLFFMYRLLWFCATPLLLRLPRLKEGAAERTLQEVNFSKVDLWIHAASIGEAYIAIQILKSFAGEQKLDILVTTNTSQGRDILENNLEEQRHNVTITYMIFDNPALVKKAVKIADPKLLVLIELEIWPALMAEMKRQEIQIMIVNGRMTEKSFKRYKKVAFLWQMLKPDTILAISEEDKARLQTLFQQKNTHQVTNIKFDQMEKCTISERTVTGNKSLILASIRKEEESEVLYIITKLLELFPNLHIDLFPRHLHRVKSWEALLSGANISYALKTVSPKNISQAVLIWDVFGELINAYQRSDAAFVGGSLAPLGGQNFIEAFMNGVIPVTGPSVSDFLWTGEEVFQNGLVKKGNTKEEVLQLLVVMLKSPTDKALIQQKADKYIHSKQGGSRKTCKYIVDSLHNLPC
jgi:3-deoxy-D-manno-octulosonic-acid transferase